MKIIGIYPSVHFRTGGQKRYLELLRGLAERGDEIILFHPDKRIFSPKELGALISCGIEMGRGLSRQRAFLRGLKKQSFSHENAQMVLIFGESALLPAVYLKRKYDLRLVTAVRNNKYVADRTARTRSLKNLVIDMRNRLRENQLVGHSDIIVFQSDYDKESYALRNKKAPSKSRVIPNSIRASWFSKSHKSINTSAELSQILFIGSDSRRKGLSLLMKALDELSQLGYKFTLTLIGDFPRTDKEALPPWCRDMGRLDHPLEEMARADLMVCPSLYDSFPNTVLESLYVGTPVIGSDVAGIKAMLKHKTLLFAPGDYTSLKETLEPLFVKDAYLNAGKLCRERLDSFDFDWIQSWKEVLSGK